MLGWEEGVFSLSDRTLAKKNDGGAVNAVAGGGGRKTRTDEDRPVSQGNVTGHVMGCGRILIYCISD
jgi:hypothetical protein